MDASTLRIVCAGLVVVFGALIFFRRRGTKADSRNGWEGRGDSTVPRPFFISGLTHFTGSGNGIARNSTPPAPLRLVVWRGRDPLESGLAPPLLPRSRRKRWRDRAPR